MEPHEPAEGTGSAMLRTEDLRRAVAIYLEHAYPTREPPEVVRRRLAWPETEELDRVLREAPFERANKPGAGASPLFALRLGNELYPHMKLQVQAWPHQAGYMLSVNTHDHVLSLDPESPDAAAFQELQAHNQHLKEVIELAWDQAGLPTFLRYLRDYIHANSVTAPANAARPDAP